MYCYNEACPHLPQSASLPCVWVCVCVCVFVCMRVRACVCVSSCFAHTLNQSLNEFPECVRERQHCRSISGESPADYMDLGINERGRFVQSEPTSGSFQQGCLTNRQTDERDPGAISLSSGAAASHCHLGIKKTRGISLNVWPDGLCGDARCCWGENIPEMWAEFCAGVLNM